MRKFELSWLRNGRPDYWNINPLTVEAPNKKTAILYGRALAKERGTRFVECREVQK